MKIYGFATFNVTKVLLTAEELMLDYDYVGLDPSKGETQSSEHLQRHPLGKVPVLEHDGRCFYESAAICRYLARINDSTLYAGSAAQMADIDRWIDYVTLHVGRWMATYFFQENVKTRFFGGEVDQAQITEAREFLQKHMPLLESQLASTEFLAGDELSIADFIAASYVQIHEVTSLDVADYSNVMRWYSSLRQRASFSRAMQHYPGNQIFD